MGITMIEESSVEDVAGDRWGLLLHAWQDADVPEGWRAEIREEGIVLVPPPAARHNENAAQITRQLYRSIPNDWTIHQGSGVIMPRLGRLRQPGLIVLPSSAVPGSRKEGIDPHDVLFAAEIVSKGNARDDRGPKLTEYAAAGIPLYLLVDGYDPRGARITLFSRPLGNDYADSHAVEWGEPIELPEPFELKLDTSEFEVPFD